jgi:hypothetical protein
MTAPMRRVAMVMPIKSDSVRCRYGKSKATTKQETDEKHWYGTVHERIQVQDVVKTGARSARPT